MKVLLLCGMTLDGFQRSVIAPFLTTRRHSLVGCLVDTRAPRPLLERLKRNLRLGRGGYVAVMALRLLLRKRRQVEATATFFRGHGVSVIATSDPYGEQTTRTIGTLKPDVLVLIGGFGAIPSESPSIIKPPLLAAAPLGVLSYHQGDMRHYRGQPPGFWELYYGEQEMGITVQRLSEGLDCGEPIVERRLPIGRAETLRSLMRRAYGDSAAGMMLEAIERLEAPDFVPETIDSYGPVFTLPNLRQWLLAQLKVSSRVVRARLRGH